MWHSCLHFALYSFDLPIAWRKTRESLLYIKPASEIPAAPQRQLKQQLVNFPHTALWGLHMGHTAGGTDQRTSPAEMSPLPRPGYSAGIWLGPISHPLSSRENERERHVLLAHYLNGRRATRVLLSDRESQPLLPPAVLLDSCALTCSGSLILQDLWLFRDSYEEHKY